MKCRRHESSEESEESSEDSREQLKTKQRKKLPDFRKNEPLASPQDQLIINLGACQYEIVRQAAEALGFRVQMDPEAADWDLYWSDYFIEGELVMKMCQHQKISHFPGIEQLTRKNLMGRNLMRMRKQFPGEFQFFPLTWLLPSQYNEFRLFYEGRPRGKARTFIVKPEGGCQGKGIFLTRDIEEVEGGKHYVVQRYLTRPLLIDQLKFDLRLYILITSVSPLRIFLYKEGLARFATRKYEIPSEDNLGALLMHLTNYAINKNSPNFVRNLSEDCAGVGHKRSYSAVLQTLSAMGHDVGKLQGQIEDTIVKTVLSSVAPIAHQFRAYQPQNLASDMCFHVIGVDIILNSGCEPILLEMNHTPSFTADTPLDRKVKLSLIKDVLALLGFSTARKAQLIQEKIQAVRLRTYTSKRCKLPIQEANELRQARLGQRFLHEEQHLGDFRRIYPPTSQELLKKYESFFQFAERAYFESAGFKRKFQEEEEQQRQKGKSCTRKISEAPRLADREPKPLVRRPQLRKDLRDSQDVGGESDLHQLGAIVIQRSRMLSEFTKSDEQQLLISSTVSNSRGMPHTLQANESAVVRRRPAFQHSKASFRKVFLQQHRERLNLEFSLRGKPEKLYKKDGRKEVRVQPHRQLKLKDSKLGQKGLFEWLESIPEGAASFKDPHRR